MSLVNPVNAGTWAGMWNLTGDKTQYQFMSGQGRSNTAYRVAREFSDGSVRDARGALAALIGAAAGGAATNTWKMRTTPAGPSGTTPGVASSFGDFGGNIGIVNNLFGGISRVTTAADVTELKKWFANGLLERGLTYPTVAGNSLSSGMQVGGQGRF